MRRHGTVFLLAVSAAMSGEACGRDDASPSPPGSDGADAGGITPDGAAFPRAAEEGGSTAGSCDPLAAFGAPERVPGLDTAGYEGSATLSSDELEIFFEVYGASTSELFTARRANVSVPFGPRSLVAVGATQASNTGPMLALDDATLVFASDRGGAWGLWRAVRPSHNAAFGPPESVTGLGVAAEGGYLAPDKTGLWLLSREANGKLDLYFAPTSGASYGAARNLTELNTAATETGPVPNANGTALYFGSSRDDQAATRLDVWIARRAKAGDAFGAPSRVDELNTAFDEWPSWLSPDGCRLYFTSNRGGSYDLYFARRSR